MTTTIPPEAEDAALDKEAARLYDLFYYPPDSVAEGWRRLARESLAKEAQIVAILLEASRMDAEIDAKHANLDELHDKIEQIYRRLEEVASYLKPPEGRW